MGGEVRWTVFTCLVQLWDAELLTVGGIAFNECTPAQAVRKRFGEQLTISRLQQWPDDMPITEAMARFERALDLDAEES